MAIAEAFMGNNKQYADEFRTEAVKQVIERAAGDRGARHPEKSRRVLCQRNNGEVRVHRRRRLS